MQNYEVLLLVFLVIILIIGTCFIVHFVRKENFEFVHLILELLAVVGLLAAVLYYWFLTNY